MRFFKEGVVLMVMLLALSGCVTSHYKNNKGCDCTRRYFTIFAISARSCGDVCQAPEETAQAEGEELKVEPLAPSPSLKKSSPAQTITQSIKTTTQALHR